MRSVFGGSIGSWIFGVALVAQTGIGCGDGSGSSATGGTGGAGGSGGATTTTTPEYPACPLGAELHVAAVIVDPSGAAIVPQAVSVKGLISGIGVDTPPTFECGSGQAWVQIENEADSTTWIACFQAPNLVVDATAGQTAELAQAVDEHGVAPASVHTTVRVDGALLVHVEEATYEAEIALPDGVTIARADKVCDSLSDPCQIEGYDTTMTAGAESVAIPAGDAGDAGGYRVYVDRYWTAKASSGCDGGDAVVRLAVTKTPGI